MTSKKLWIFGAVSSVLLLSAGAAGFIMFGSSASASHSHISATQGQVSLGTTRDYVESTFGAPRFITAHMEGRQLVEVWGYHFSGESRPVLLSFHEGELVDAARSSYADIDARYGVMPFQLAMR